MESGPFVVSSESSLLHALEAISANRNGIVFVVDPHGLLIGSLSDGDFRRWLAANPSTDLNESCRPAANKNCHTSQVGRENLLGDVPSNVKFLPVIDDRRRVVGMYSERHRDFSIDDYVIKDDSPVFVIAEIGINHNGSLVEAMRLVDAAVESQADCVKLQLRSMSHLYRDAVTGLSGEDLGAQYTLDLLNEVSLTTDETLAVLDHIRASGVVPLCTPWDQDSAEILHAWGVPGFKTASADLTNEPLLGQLAEWGRPVIASTGMSTEGDIRGAVKTFDSGVSPYALLHCNSAYPAPFKDIHLNYLRRLTEISGVHVGYSGHERGHHVVLGAVTLGARIVEKHITMDKSARGIDHKVSLEPMEFGSMVIQIRELESALGSAMPRKVSQGEALNRLALSKSVVAKRELPKGHVIQRSDLDIKSPGRGLQPNRLTELIGKQLHRSLQAGDFFFDGDVKGELSTRRKYRFNRPWGLPVRFHDWRSLSEGTNPNFLEFHLSYRDLGLPIRDFFDNRLPIDLVVHSPDLFENDLILDLASDDKSWRQRSTAELQKVIYFTEELREFFSTDGETLLVVSLGGSTLDSPLPRSERARGYDRVLEELASLNVGNVRILAQTLPPFPWYLGGQRYCNLFVEPDELENFCKESGLELCLDLAHTKLACTSLKQSFLAACERLLPYTRHLHLVDAAGVDDEGLQILEGEIEWDEVATIINKLPQSVGFIPEIWQGHVDDGAGFWTALDRLESLAI